MVNFDGMPAKVCAQWRCKRTGKLSGIQLCIGDSIFLFEPSLIGEQIYRSVINRSKPGFTRKYRNRFSRVPLPPASRYPNLASARIAEALRLNQVKITQKDKVGHQPDYIMPEQLISMINQAGEMFRQDLLIRESA